MDDYSDNEDQYDTLEEYNSSLSSDDEFYDAEDLEDYSGIEIEPPDFITPFKSNAIECFNYNIEFENRDVEIQTLKDTLLFLQDKINIANIEKIQLQKHLQDIITTFNQRINLMMTPNNDSFLVSNFAKSKKTTLSTMDMIERLSRVVNIGIADIATDLQINLKYPFYNPSVFYDHIEIYPTDKVDLNYIDPRTLGFWHAFNKVEKK